jgi:serine/threonine protein kinase
MTQPRLLGDRYELEGVVGRGGMAEVYRARDLRLDRVVAIKTLRADLARDQTFQARFRREAQSAASLNNPSIVAVYDTGVDMSTRTPMPFIVMEYIDGRTVRDLLIEGHRLLPERTLEIVSGVLRALEYSHQAGIVHRDIKPGNVMVTRNGDVKVMDFGIARAMSDGQDTMTQTGQVIGTAQYLSPEQARGERVDARSDLYSTGCLMYELLVGRPPFTGDSPVAIAYQHVRENPIPPSRLDPDLPPWADAIVLKAMAKSPNDRYQSAAEMNADFQRAASGKQVGPGKQVAPGKQVGPGPTSPTTRSNFDRLLGRRNRMVAGVSNQAEDEIKIAPARASPNVRPPARTSRSDTTTAFEVAIRHGDGRGAYTVEVISPESGEAFGALDLDIEDLLSRRDQIQMAVLASSAASRRALPDTERPVRDIGKLLFTALLGTGEVAGRYRAAQAVASERGQRLRVVLRINAPALAALPWESMYDESADGYLSRLDPLVRQAGVASVLTPMQVQPPLRILGVVSSPRGLPALDTEREQENLERALARPVSQGRIELDWAPAATWADLQTMLLEGPWHVVHYIGHGDFDPAQDEGYLSLVGHNGRVHNVAAHRLVDLMRQADPMPRLAVLNSCEGAQVGSDLFSSTAAALVRGGFNAVAAMQYAISDQAAIAFARGFYTALALGRGVDQAVHSGRVAILGTGEHTLEWLTPVLYLRGRETRLFAMS